MEENLFYQTLTKKALNGEKITQEEAQQILDAPQQELLPLVTAAYQVRKEYWNNDVTIHILNNAQNGNCPEDCGYCAQAKTADTDIYDYPIKSEEEILEEAKEAYEAGAYRYCMVFAGRGPRKRRVEKLAGIIKNIKETYPLEVCLSPGLLDSEDTEKLKEAGLDRLNHNLNTSESYYKEICTTHTYEDRLNTLNAAQKSGLELCSGIIVGMGETDEDIIQVATKLRELETKSIPVNFYMHIEGNKLGPKSDLTPERCLKILCLYRFLNPKAEIRMAAGRELQLRSLQALGLYPANSLFMEGYLNTKGTDQFQTLQMIKDAGFTIKSDQNIDSLIQALETQPNTENTTTPCGATQTIQNKAILKTDKDLRPTLSN